MLLNLLVAFSQAKAEYCQECVSSQASVIEIEDDFTLVLSDGRRIYLADIDYTGHPAELGEIFATLQNKTVTVVTWETKGRYGTIPTVIFLGEENFTSLLLIQGLVRKFPSPSPFSQVFQQNEQSARERELGVWANPLTRTRQALDLEPSQNGMAVITATVKLVSRIKGQMEIKFLESRFAPKLIVKLRAGKNVEKFASELLGKTIMARGLIDMATIEHGPVMEIVTLDQIDIISTAD